MYESESRSVVSTSLLPWTVACRLLCPWNSPGQNTGVGSCFFSRGSSQPRDWTQVFHIAGRFFTLWATRKAQVSYPKYISPFAWPLNPCAEASWNISVQLCLPWSLTNPHASLLWLRAKVPQFSTMGVLKCNRYTLCVRSTQSKS